MSDWQYPGFQPPTPKDPCDGCRECAMRCTSGIQMTAHEFTQIVAELRRGDPARAIRVLEQEKRLPWFEEITREACLFFDVTQQDCLVYPARPLICRLFGRVEWLPCPVEKPLMREARGIEIIKLYATERRATFAEWCMEHGIFDLRRLVTDPR